MTIEMPRGLPFSVDTFGPYTKTTKRMKRHHFLTHAHKDHTVGITPHNIVFPIYSTSLTISLLLQRQPQVHESFFVRIETGQSLIVSDPDGDFKVTAFDANHCPGAVMFLFEGSFGNILHTGDCRLTLDCIQSLPEKFVGRQDQAPPKCCLDYIFLDCTFGKSFHRFPTKHSAIRQIINCIWNHPDAQVVYLACDMLGQEDILLQVSRTFGSTIYVDKATNFECYRSLMLIVPEIVSEDPSSRFHILSGFPKLYERASAKLAEARSKHESEPLIIRPSAQWYVCDDDDDDYESVSQIQKQRKVRFNEAVKDEFGIWHVCYSMHSSREELESALKLLSPRWVVSTVPSCRAMELDYVKKNCFISKFSSDDPFWKLLDMDIEVSSVASTLSCCLNKDSTEPLIEGSTIKKQNLPITLFGRARLSSDQLHERKAEKLNLEKVVESLQDDDTKQEIKEDVSCRSSSCRDLSGELRKLYRSMNAPVPRPLPSLMELMKARKRSRKSLNY